MDQLQAGLARRSLKVPVVLRHDGTGAFDRKMLYLDGDYIRIRDTEWWESTKRYSLELLSPNLHGVFENYEIAVSDDFADILKEAAEYLEGLPALSFKEVKELYEHECA